MKKSIRNVFDSALLRSAWRRLVQLWKPMGLWTLFVWTLIAVILAPISSAVLGLQFFRNGKLVIGNEELLSWLLSPVGMGYILLASTLALTAWIIRFAGLFQIVSDSIYGRTVNFRDIILRITLRIPTLFRLCLFIVAATLLLVLPLATGFAFIYELFLDAYDINYYLSETPLEWYLALLVSTVWSAIWLVGVAYLVARSLLAVPAYLHTQKSILESLAYAWNLDQKQSRSNIKTILLTIGMWIIIRLAADGIFFVTSSEIISGLSSNFQNLRIIAMATGVYVMGSIMIDAVISFLGFSHVSTLITKLYYSESQPSDNAPLSQPKQKKITSFLKTLFRPKRFISIIIIIMLGSVLISGYLIEQIPQPKTDTVDIVAHRAGPPPAPENTLKALNNTLQTGAEYAEIDVQLSSDSVVVVTHDIDLMRIANDPARIAETEFRELQQIVANAHPKQPNHQNTINTLDEFLDVAKGRIKLMVELKYPHSALVNRTIDAIRQKNMTSETAIISMDLEALQQVSNRAPEITTGYISAFSLGNISQLPVELLAINQRSITNQLITDAHQQNLDLYAWTVNRASKIAIMIELGIDGIITDNPKLALQIRQEIRDLTTTERLLLQFQQLVIHEDK